MSPLKIETLLRLHTRPEPMIELPHEQKHAPAMREAYDWFADKGLLVDGVTWYSVAYGEATYPFLTDAGRELVKRLCEVEP